MRKADCIKERAIREGMYIVQNKATVRATAHIFNISRSTVYKDVTTRLEVISPSLFIEVRKVLQKNKAERAGRGGKALRTKKLKVE